MPKQTSGQVGKKELDEEEEKKEQAKGEPLVPFSGKCVRIDGKQITEKQKNDIISKKAS